MLQDTSQNTGNGIFEKVHFKVFGLSVPRYPVGVLSARIASSAGVSPEESGDRKNIGEIFFEKYPFAG